MKALWIRVEQHPVDMTLKMLLNIDVILTPFWSFWLLFVVSVDESSLPFSLLLVYSPNIWKTELESKPKAGWWYSQWQSNPLRMGVAMQIRSCEHRNVGLVLRWMDVSIKLLLSYTLDIVMRCSKMTILFLNFLIAWLLLSKYVLACDGTCLLMMFHFSLLAYIYLKSCTF